MNRGFQPAKVIGKPLSKSARILLGIGVGAGVVIGWHTWATMNITLAKLLIGGAIGGGLVALVTVGAGQYRVVQKDPEQTEEDLIDLIQRLQHSSSVALQPPVPSITQPLPEFSSRNPIDPLTLLVRPERSAAPTATHQPMSLQRQGQEEPNSSVDEALLLHGEFPTEDETESISNGRR